MGKITGILSIFLLAAFLTFQTPTALADNGPQDICDDIIIQEYQNVGGNRLPLELDPKKTPTLILSDHKQFKQARFIIQDSSINNSVEYKMDFRCKQILSPQTAQTAIAQKPYIYLDLDRTTGWNPLLDPCEFSKGSIEIWVTAGNYKVCRASYEVVSSDTLCKLELDANDKNKPVKDLEPGLRVTGSKLTDPGNFELFFDNQKILRKWSGDFPQNNFDLHTPAFPEKPELPVYIPKEYLAKLGRHRVDIRRRYIHVPGPFGVDNGPALCPLDFVVESPDKPVKILNEQDLKECKSGPNCSSGTSQKCKNETKPSIKTAIGCIHTNPGDLIADVLKFAVGIGGGLAFLMMLLGAFQMLTSAGNPETLAAGKDRLTSAIIGLLVIIFSVLLLQIIGFDILGIPGFGR